MSDTLGHLRKVARFIASQKRRELKRKMDRYNSLSNKTGEPPKYDRDGAKTTNDVIAETLAIAKQGSLGRGGGRFSLSHDSSDKLLSQCNVVQPEVRTLWQQKIGMHNLLSAANKETLRQMPVASIRESRLNDLAKWMVWMWCDEEGYDPDKHPKR